MHSLLFFLNLIYSFFCSSLWQITHSLTSSIPWSINSNADLTSTPSLSKLLESPCRPWSWHRLPGLGTFLKSQRKISQLLHLIAFMPGKPKTMWIDDTTQTGCLFGTDPCSFYCLKQLFGRRKPLSLSYFTNFLPFKCKARWFSLTVLILTIKAHGFAVTLSFLVLSPLQTIHIFFFMCLTCSSFSS